MNSANLYAMLPTFFIRLALAGLLGFLIGLERDFRAKEAGARTHFLVAMGSALIMIASQWGFTDMAKLGVHFDSSRVAAQIVSGIGFIGAGTIMMHKEFVRGLTTAAALWVTSGIGIAVGGGLYHIGIAATLLTLIGMEILPLFTRKIKVKSSMVIFTASAGFNLAPLIEQMSAEGYSIISYEVEPHKMLADKIRVRMVVHEHYHGNGNQLLSFLHRFPNVSVEKIE